MQVYAWTVFALSLSGIWSIRDHIVGCWSLALDLWDLVIEVLGTTPKFQKSTQACMRETDATIQSTLKDQNVDLSNVGQVPSSAHISEIGSQLYIFEDNEAVIKMITQSKSPTMRHVSPHSPSCSGLVIRQNQPGSKSPNQVCRIQKPTRRHLNRRQFHT